MILSIWIEGLNWKPIKLLPKGHGKKLEIQIMRIKFENIIFGKLELKDEIE